MSDQNNIKLWSNLGMRATFGLIALELAKQHPELIITTSDVSTSAGLDRYKKKYPDKVQNILKNYKIPYKPSDEINLYNLFREIKKNYLTPCIVFQENTDYCKEIFIK